VRRLAALRTAGCGELQAIAAAVTAPGIAARFIRASYARESVPEA
jgi:hypothetical protein